ncbi:hypothetical protein V5799_029219 [Amblyomma americanum]|uniref:C1q domain-containing protein n=1 Tax=Amblyomma americanum TaxID=6943 RepID=A0AAQ4ERS7_AMBAM
MSWLPPLVEIDRASLLPRSQSGFFWELSEEIRARKGKELRLHPFHRPGGNASVSMPQCQYPGVNNAGRDLTQGPCIYPEMLLQPFAEGSFERGPGLNATRGMFRAPMNGIYVFFATAYVTRPTSPRAMRKHLESSSNDASLFVCVNARCQKNL